MMFKRRQDRHIKKKRDRKDFWLAELFYGIGELFFYIIKGIFKFLD
jgi:hypothetical protein